MSRTLLRSVLFWLPCLQILFRRRGAASSSPSSAQTTAKRIFRLALHGSCSFSLSSSLASASWTFSSRSRWSSPIHAYEHIVSVTSPRQYVWERWLFQPSDTLMQSRYCHDDDPGTETNRASLLTASQPVESLLTTVTPTSHRTMDGVAPTSTLELCIMEILEAWSRRTQDALFVFRAVAVGVSLITLDSNRTRWPSCAFLEGEVWSANTNVRVRSDKGNLTKTFMVNSLLEIVVRIIR